MIMRKLIYKKDIRGHVGRRFAIWPTIVSQAHPSDQLEWLIWLEWYEVDDRFTRRKWLITS